MSSSYIVSNNGISTLAGAISSSTQTSITVTAGHGVRFPSPTGGDYTLVTLENAAGTIEIVSIVGRATDTLTVGIAGSAAANSAGRGMEGTTATTWAIGDIVEGRVTAAIAQRGGNAKTVVELAASSGAALIGNTPAGSIAATTVQAAINELDTEKAALAGSASQVFSASTAAAGTNTTQVATTAFVFGMRSKVISGTRDMTAATGNVSYTGVGFRPRKITVHSIIAGTRMVSEGVGSSAANSYCQYLGDSIGYDYILNGKLIHQFSSAGGGANQSAVIASMDSDGFTLTWTKNATPSAETAMFSFFCEE